MYTFVTKSINRNDEDIDRFYETEFGEIFIGTIVNNYVHPTKTRFGKEEQTYDLIGRLHMDYLQLYRKYTYHEMHSYSLDAIGEYEIGEKKTAYEGSIDYMYKNDFEKYFSIWIS